MYTKMLTYTHINIQDIKILAYVLGRDGYTFFKNPRVF